MTTATTTTTTTTTKPETTSPAEFRVHESAAEEEGGRGDGEQEVEDEGEADPGEQPVGADGAVHVARPLRRDRGAPAEAAVQQPDDVAQHDEADQQRQGRDAAAGSKGQRSTACRCSGYIFPAL